MTANSNTRSAICHLEEPISRARDLTVALRLALEGSNCLGNEEISAVLALTYTLEDTVKGAHGGWLAIHEAAHRAPDVSV